MTSYQHWLYGLRSKHGCKYILGFFVRQKLILVNLDIYGLSSGDEFRCIFYVWGKVSEERLSLFHYH